MAQIWIESVEIWSDLGLIDIELSVGWCVTVLEAGKINTGGVG